VKQDTAEVMQALDNLRKAYDEAAKSNTALVGYIDAEVPGSPYSPVRGSQHRRILLAREWARELITKVHKQSLRDSVLVVGDPGSGKSLGLVLPLKYPSVCIANCNLGKTFTLVGYLLFCLNALGIRVILQTSASSTKRLGFIFDSNGIHAVSTQNAEIYDDGKPCYLLVSADGTLEYPSPELDFCSNIIVVTSPNLPAKPELRNWRKQFKAEQFIVPPTSCLEVVYLLYVKPLNNLLVVY
jgi:hypothetical protein